MSGWRRFGHVIREGSTVDVNGRVGFVGWPMWFRSSPARESATTDPAPLISAAASSGRAIGRFTKGLCRERDIAGARECEAEAVEDAEVGVKPRPSPEREGGAEQARTRSSRLHLILGELARIAK
jgi:hypothetical protein